MSKVFVNASEIVTPMGKTALRGNEMNGIMRLKNGVVVVENNLIVYVGRDYKPNKNDEVIDCRGGMILPAFIDSHTHLVFGGERSNEFRMRLAGASYAEIMSAGGGIAATTQATRASLEDELFTKAEKHLYDFACQGILAVEAKSGYGLDFETEIKQLNVAERLNGAPLEIISTYMGAHAVPDGQTADSYIDYIIDEVLPVVSNIRTGKALIEKNAGRCSADSPGIFTQKRKLRGKAEFCDIFVEKGAFSPQQARKLFAAAVEYGFKLKMHADELNDLGGSALAVELKCVSADHLLRVSEEGITALANSATIATLLPLTAFSLQEQYAPARRLIDAGCAVALATDFNPGSCYSNSIPMLISLAAMYMKMTASEIISALTLNAAAAVSRAEVAGSIEVGKRADIIILDVKTPDELIYYFGHNAVAAAYKDGKELRWPTKYN